MGGGGVLVVTQPFWYSNEKKGLGQLAVLIIIIEGGGLACVTNTFSGNVFCVVSFQPVFLVLGEWGLQQWSQLGLL